MMRPHLSERYNAVANGDYKTRADDRVVNGHTEGECRALSVSIRRILINDVQPRRSLPVPPLRCATLSAVGRHFTLQFDSLNRVLLVTFDAATTEGTVIEAFDVIRKFVAENGPCNMIRDYTASKSISSPRFVQHLGTLPALTPPGWRHIVVVAHPVQYGVVRQLQGLRAKSDGDRYQPAESTEEAWQSLGVTEPRLTPVEF